MEFSVGVILIVMSIVHIIYGEKNQVVLLKKLTRDTLLIGSVRVMSFQGGILLFAVGVLYILSSIRAISLTGIATYVPVGLILMNMLSLIIVALAKHKELIVKTIPQLIIFAIIVVLQILIIVRG